MNTVAHHEGSRMLEELYSNHGNNPHGAPFNANQSDISYINSEEAELQGEDGPSSLMHSGNNGMVANASERLSSIAQDKSPIIKPFIPPLNLNGLQNR